MSDEELQRLADAAIDAAQVPTMTTTIYTPTPAEIEAACQDIQLTWTEAEWRLRLSGSTYLTKFPAAGVKQAARAELDHRLARKRQKMRQART